MERLILWFVLNLLSVSVPVGAVYYLYGTRPFEVAWHDIGVLVTSFAIAHFLATVGERLGKLPEQQEN